MGTGLILSVLTMAGLTLFVVSFAPSLQAGNLITGLLSLALAAISPVYFTMEQAPFPQAARLRLARWTRPTESASLRARRRLDGAGGTGRIRGRDDVAGPVAAVEELRPAEAGWRCRPTRQ